MSLCNYGWISHSVMLYLGVHNGLSINIFIAISYWANLGLGKATCHYTTDCYAVGNEVLIAEIHYIAQYIWCWWMTAGPWSIQYWLISNGCHQITRLYHFLYNIYGLEIYSKLEKVIFQLSRQRYIFTLSNNLI